jgi:acetoin utilization protein AcuC
MKTALIHSDGYRRYDYGPEHPLRMERLGLTYALIEALGLTRLPEGRVVEPVPASDAVLRQFHSTEYLAALRAASAGEAIPAPHRYGLGPGDNPIWPGCFEASALACGGSIQGAELLARGEVQRAFAFAGGLHHAMPDRASGFCYLNDAVLAILALRARGWRVCYIDIDAHHGDGVQAAFYDRADVLTISTHERGDRLFPGTGSVDEIGVDEGRGYAVNLPLNPYTDDAVYLDAFDAVVPPLVEAFRPDVVVAQLGIDSHRTDPLTHLALTVDGFAAAVRRIVRLAPRLLALGGGGYDLRNVARAWTVAWALMNEADLPDRLPADFLQEARAHFGGRDELWDPPAPLPLEVVRAAREYAEHQVAKIIQVVFPIVGARSGGS